MMPPEALPMIRAAALRIASLLAAIAMILISRIADADPGVTVTEFQFKAIGDKSLGLWEDSQPVLVYNFGLMSLRGVRDAGTRSSYVHPIYGLDGEVLTDDFPADHYHHHGLFWGWPHVKIGDREYDLWKMQGIRIDFQRWLTKEVSDNRATLRVENGWFVGDKKVMSETVRLKVYPATPDGRNVDVALTWTPTDKPVLLGGAEGKSYGGVTLRFAPREGTVITVPNGRTTEDLLVTRLPWADLSAQFKGAPRPSGATLFVRPDHPGYPPEWMTREYGVLAIGWPGVKAIALPVGKSVDCHYRLWIHRGVPEAAAIQREYDAYRREK
jgi:hypothetical protein